MGPTNGGIFLLFTPPNPFGWLSTVNSIPPAAILPLLPRDQQKKNLLKKEKKTKKVI